METRTLLFTFTADFAGVLVIFFSGLPAGFFYRVLKRAHDVFPDLVEVRAQKGDPMGVELIQAPCPGLAVGHQSGILEYAKVLGDSRTADRQSGGQFMDGQGTVGQPLNDGHAAGISEGVKAGLKVSVHLR
jgi:hypothetical protein